jgi:1-aminocyclopropane-1-carboxylate deaminase/D-cysteine desulfhydrase-like pyridoxal-dependent ACC family enzyme/DNA modification methylase
VFEGFDLDLTGFENTDFLNDDLLKENDTGVKGSFNERFLFAPFSVLSARDGRWQERKRQWIDIGIKSELGRNAESYSQENLNKLTGASIKTGVSVFDPVLCELIYSWFSSHGDTVFDPFAGGSVRGIVAAKLGRDYFGIDLRKEQVQSNEKQWESITDRKQFNTYLSDFSDDLTPEITPVELLDGFYFKRDDAFSIGGGKGGKVRTCWSLAQNEIGLVTAGSRSSPQANIVAQISRKLKIPCRLHVPKGELSPELLMAKEAGAEIIQHEAGYNNVIISRAKSDAKKTGWKEIPFGMECVEAVNFTAKQVANIPSDAKRIVVPVGSGMTLAGILHGLKNADIKKPVIGIQVGAAPEKRLDKYAPKNWRDMVTLIKSQYDYADIPKCTSICGIQLDPIYESKCIPYMEKGDLLWIVGLRASYASGTVVKNEPIWKCGDSLHLEKIASNINSDLVFSCPPYADLEVYSNDPNDLSTMEYEKFLEVYREIIKKSYIKLKDDRFACFVVGEVRGKNGAYINFVNETVKAFIDAGFSYYNEMILVTPVGTLPVRAGRQFQVSRKIGKTHQNVLVFVKGDSKKAAERLGDVLIDDSMECDYEN